MSAKEEFSKELEKLKKMSFQDTIWYLWSYYKVYLVLFLAAAAFLGVVATAFYNTTFTTRLGVAMVNNHSPNPQNADLLEEQLRRILNCGKKDLVEINSGLYLGEEANAEDSYLAQTKLAALMASDALDLLIADQETIELYAQADSLWNLEQLLSESQSAVPEENFCLSSDSAGNPLPFSLSLEGTWLSENSYLSQDCVYLAVIKSSPRTEAAVQVINSLFP